MPSFYRLIQQGVALLNSYYAAPMRNCNDPRGRANRGRFWVFVAVFFFIFILAGVLDNVFGFYVPIPALGSDSATIDVGALSVAVVLTHAVPIWVLGARRMHDLGLSSWWLILGLFPLVGSFILIGFFLWPGDAEENGFGPPDARPLEPRNSR